MSTDIISSFLLLGTFIVCVIYKKCFDRDLGQIADSYIDNPLSDDESKSDETKDIVPLNAEACIARKAISGTDNSSDHEIIQQRKRLRVE